jgi:hypothetical protein
MKERILIINALRLQERFINTFWERNPELDEKRLELIAQINEIREKIDAE